MYQNCRKIYHNTAPIDPSCFSIVEANTIRRLTNRQKHNMISYQSHFFKLATIDCNNSWKMDFPEIDSVYVCCHCSKKCSAKFILMQNGFGKQICEHNDDLFHFLDIQNQRRYDFISFVRSKLEEDEDFTPAEIVTKYLKRNETVIDVHSPDKNYMFSKISKLKSELLGEIPREDEKISIEDLTLKYPMLKFQQLNYSYKGEQFDCLVIHSDFQDKISSRPGCTLIGDGTYSVVPKIYKQLYTCHVVLGSVAIPNLFVLSHNRPKELYNVVFKYLKDVIHCNPSIFMSDFEKAARSAIADVFPGILVKGCHFHYVQALIKNMKDKGLGPEYSSNPTINEIIRCYTSLAFVPIENVSEYHDSIKYKINSITNLQLNSLLINFDIYFTETWLDGMFSIADWNQLLDIEHRTNNWCESFHSAFARRFKASHPNVIKFLNKLNDTLVYHEFNYNNYLMNINTYHDKDTSEITDQILNVIKKRETIYFGEHYRFLCALSKTSLVSVLKIEREFIVNNDDKKERLHQIDLMLKGEMMISLIDETDDSVELTKKELKLKCLTKRNIIKKRKQINEKIKEGKKERRRKKVDILYDKEVKEQKLYFQQLIHLLKQIILMI